MSGCNGNRIHCHLIAVNDSLCILINLNNAESNIQSTTNTLFPLFLINLAHMSKIKPQYLPWIIYYSLGNTSFYYFFIFFLISCQNKVINWHFYEQPLSPLEVLVNIYIKFASCGFIFLKTKTKKRTSRYLSNSYAFLI